MNKQEVQAILLTYRPWLPEPEDARVAEALELARSDSALRAWFDAHCTRQNALRDTFRRTPLPDTLRRPIRPPARVLQLPGLVRTWVAAAAILLLLGIALGPWRRVKDGTSFAVLRDRMVQSVLRGYPMDLATSDETALRTFLRRHQAPSDYALGPSLSRLPVVGGGLRSWRDTKVAMVCLEAPDRRTLFVFVTDRSRVRDAPSAALRWETVKGLATAGWSADNRTYLVAMDVPQEQLESYVGGGPAKGGGP